MLRDIKAMLWKEYAQFRKNTFNEIGLLVFFAAIMGVGVPLLSLSDPGMSGARAFAIILAGSVIFAAYYVTTFASDGTFGEEIQSGALRMLLVTRLRPTAIFAAKWLALMVRAVALVIAVTVLQVTTVLLRAGSLDSMNAGWAAWGAGMGLLLAAYTAAVNGAVSLVAKSMAQLRQLGMIATFLPVMALVGFGYLIGYEHGAVAFLSVLLVVLTILSFALAILMFRSEKTRA